jgi:hypothetical protein
LYYKFEYPEVRNRVCARCVHDGVQEYGVQQLYLYYDDQWPAVYKNASKDCTQKVLKPTNNQLINLTNEEVHQYDEFNQVFRPVRTRACTCTHARCIE